jgi:gas vesicle protein
MIYGHQFDRGWTTADLCVGVAVGAAIGAGIGLLFAPQLGNDLRRSLGTTETRTRLQAEARSASIRTSIGPDPQPTLEAKPEEV